MMIKSVQKEEGDDLSKKAKSQSYPMKAEKTYSQPDKTDSRTLAKLNTVSQPKAEASSSLPNSIRQRVEKASGLEMKGVKVHYHSSAPAQLQALAYTKGNDIYLGKGQEKYLSHEAWHVAQQKQGRVVPQFKIGGESVNHDRSLEKEADSFAKGELLHQTVPAKPEFVRPADVAQGVLRIGLNPLAVSEKKIDQQNILSAADKAKAKELIKDNKWHWYFSMSRLKKDMMRKPKPVRKENDYRLSEEDELLSDEDRLKKYFHVVPMPKEMEQEMIERKGGTGRRNDPMAGENEAPIMDPMTGEIEAPIMDPMTGEIEAPTMDSMIGENEAPIMDPMTGKTETELNASVVLIQRGCAEISSFIETLKKHYLKLQNSINQ